MYISYCTYTHINVLYLYISYRHISHFFFEIKDLPNKRDLTWFCEWSLSELAVLWHLSAQNGWLHPPNQLPGPSLLCGNLPGSPAPPETPAQAQGLPEGQPQDGRFGFSELFRTPGCQENAMGKKNFLRSAPSSTLNWSQLIWGDWVPRLLMGQNCWDG